MKEPKDKRTKAYKKWLKHQKELQKDIDNKEAFIDKGLGDVVEKITEKTGIKKVVKKVFGDDCGCEERKQKLNKIRFRYPIVRCFTEELYNEWSEFRKTKGDLTYKQQMLIVNTYNHLFARSLKKLNCCYEQYINEINRVFEKY